MYALHVTSDYIVIKVYMCGIPCIYVMPTNVYAEFVYIGYRVGCSVKIKKQSDPKKFLN